jgi:hypothetical protein
MDALADGPHAVVDGPAQLNKQVRRAGLAGGARGCGASSGQLRARARPLPPHLAAGACAAR